MAQQVVTAPRNTLSDGGLTAVVVSFIFSFLAIIFVGLRFYVRRVKKVEVLVEDWLILTALVCPSRMGGSLIDAGDLD